MKKHFQNHFLILKILIFILTFSMLSGCTFQIGSYIATSDYSPTPLKAYEAYGFNYDHLTQTYTVIQKEIGVFKLDDDYSIYIVILGKEKDGKITHIYPDGMLMQTHDGKYHYTAIHIEIDTEKEKDTQIFKIQGKERKIDIIKKDAFDESAYNKEKYNIQIFSIPENNITTEMVFVYEKLQKE